MEPICGKHALTSDSSKSWEAAFLQMRVNGAPHRQTFAEPERGAAHLTSAVRVGSSQLKRQQV